MFRRLSQKAFNPPGINDQRELNLLHQNKLFYFGLFVRVFLVFSFLPIIHDELFHPFLKNTLNNLPLDPWTDFLESSDASISFPYGLTMLLSYLPITSLGFSLDDFLKSTNFFRLFFSLNTLIFDYSTLIVLSILTKHRSNSLLIFLYWLSPLVLYINYIHGQLDIVPISFLLWSICLVQWNRYILSSIFLGIAICSKFSMLLALPLIIIFIYKRRGLSLSLVQFCLGTISTLSIVILPFINSTGFKEMVLNTPEIFRLYAVSISYAPGLKLYVVPVIYLLTLYLCWRLDRITKDLFILSTGLSFFALLIFLPPAPGWFLWVIPFLIYYQINSKKDILGIDILFSLACLSYISLYSTGAYFLADQNTIFPNQILSKINFNSSQIPSFIFTALQAISIILALRIYTYGLKRNAFYKANDKPVLITFSGNILDLTNRLVKSVSSLIGPRKINNLNTSKFLNKFRINDTLLSKEIDTQKFKNIDIPSLISVIDNPQSQNIQFFQNLNHYRNKNIIASISNYLNAVTSVKPQYTFLNVESSFPPKPIREISDLSVILTTLSNQDCQSQIKPPFDVNQLVFWLLPVNNQDSTNLRKRMITYLPSGYLHVELFRMLISISAIHIDTEITHDLQWVKMNFEGEVQPDDLSHIARLLIPQIEDFCLFDEYWLADNFGIIQLIILYAISKTLQSTTAVRQNYSSQVT